MFKAGIEEKEILDCLSFFIAFRLIEEKVDIDVYHIMTNLELNLEMVELCEMLD